MIGLQSAQCGLCDRALVFPDPRHARLCDDCYRALHDAAATREERALAASRIALLDEIRAAASRLEAGG